MQYLLNVFLLFNLDSRTWDSDGSDDNEESGQGGSDSDEELSFSELMLPNHFRCASHTLNLIATTDFLNIIKKNEHVFSKHKVAFSR